MKSASIDEHFVLSTTVIRLLIELFQMPQKLILKKRRKKKSNRKYCKWATNVIVMLLSSSLYIKYVFAHHFELKLSK